MIDPYPKSKCLGPLNTSACPECGNSLGHGIPDDAPDLRRCASCKLIFSPMDVELEGIPTFLHHFRTFLNYSKERNKWVQTPLAEIYFRKATRLFNNKMIKTLDIATILIEIPGEGTFTKLLPQLHEMHNYDATYIENAHDPRFRAWILKQPGWTNYPNSDRCFIKMK